MIIQEAPSRYQDFQVEVEEAMEENGECSKSISNIPQRAVLQSKGHSERPKNAQGKSRTDMKG